MTHLTKITRLDKVRIKKTLKALRHTPLYNQYSSFLHDIEEATIIDSLQVPDDLVTMNSRVVYEDCESTVRYTVDLVYPRYENTAEGKVSILSPLGIALFGSTVNTVTDYQNGTGMVCKVRIIEILYQPEMSGHYLI